MEIAYHQDNKDVLKQFIERAFDTKEWFDLKTEAERLSLTEGFDRLLSLETLGLDLFDHQRRAVMRVLQELRGRAILADEVGLGKTIEAGVILKEYLLRGLVQRALILVPASLVSQWRHELREKFHLTFRVATSPGDFENAPWVLASIDTAKRPQHAQSIAQGVWDLVIVDEAHRLKNQSTLNWRFVNAIQKKYLLLLTATPVQNDLRELYNLVTLLKPGQLKTYSQFKRSFMTDKHSPKNTAALRAALAEVMVRSKRRDSLLPFPRRDVRTLFVPFSDGEKSYYRSVLMALQKAYRSMPKDDRNVLPLILVLREMCSHPMAAQQSLLAMCERRSMPTLTRESVDAWGRNLKGLTPNKVRRLIGFLKEAKEAAIVFTEFRTTQKALVRALAFAGFECHAFHGGLSNDQKEDVIRAFRQKGGVLVSTESGGEGMNLQFCRTVINYDLPWNPMRVEQRIGRVHRLGQERTVQVINMVSEGAIDAYVLYLLEKKIDMFQRVIGEVDEILTNLDRSFEAAVADAVLGSQDTADLQRRIDAFGRELEGIVHRYDRVRAWNRALFEETEEVGSGP